MITRVVPPPNSPNSLSIDGQNLQIGSDGTFSVDAKYVLGLLGNGYSIAADDVLASTMAQVGAAGVVPGFSFFETSLNKPVFRSANNSAWLDAMGNVVG